jgi:hypothetical protein
MFSILSSSITAVRVWLGLNDPAENHMQPSHGWLLPPIAGRSQQPALAVAPASIRPPVGE